METEQMPAAPAIKRRRKKSKVKRAAPRKRVVQIPATHDEGALAGLSATECPFDCGEAKCVLTGIGVCGHPNKGAPKMQNDPVAMRIYNEARKILAHQVLDKKP